MTLNYHNVWEAMNELELVTCKVSSAREILECAIDALESGNHEKAETLMYATDEFLKYYLNDFDEKFKVAWKETVTKLKHQEYDAVYKCDKEDSSPECNNAWNDFWEENYYPEEHKEDKVKKWQLPVEADGPSGEYFVTFPDDLLEAANLKEGDKVEWVDQGDGSYLLKKVN